MTLMVTRIPFVGDDFRAPAELIVDPAQLDPAGATVGQVLGRTANGWEPVAPPAGVTIKGSYATVGDLQTAHPTGQEGDGYLVAGDLYVWNGTAWENVGTIQGPAGADGEDGEDGAPGVNSWGAIPDKPDVALLDANGKLDATVPLAKIEAAVIAAGATEAAARQAISAARTPGVVYDLRGFNPTGDGLADDKTPLQNALSSLPAGATLDMHGLTCRVTSAVSIATARVKIINGKILAGQHPAVTVSAADVTLENVTIERSTGSPGGATTAERSGVVVTAPRFTSKDGVYKDANIACIYIAHASGDGSTITGGTITNASARQDACAVYAAAGATGNKAIRIKDVTIVGAGCSQAVLLFDPSGCVVESCKISGIRKLPDVTLTGWTLVSGTTYRTPERADGTTRVVRKNGTQIAENTATPATPSAGQWGVPGDGYVYLNEDPVSGTFTSQIVSGYGVTFYLTSAPRMDRNVARNCELLDLDGIGIYIKGHSTDASLCQGNGTSGNKLTDTCLSGVQDSALAFGAIGVAGVSDCLLTGDTILRYGSASTKAPGIMLHGKSSGRLVGASVKDGQGNGIRLHSSGWTLTSCTVNGATDHGYYALPDALTSPAANNKLIGCDAIGCGGRGVNMERYVETGLGVQIIGGTYQGNTGDGIMLLSARDSLVMGVECINNGGTQIRLRGTSDRCVVSEVMINASGTNALGVTVDSTTTNCMVGRITTRFGVNGTPLTISNPIRTGGAPGFMEEWIGAVAPEGAVTAPPGSTYRRSSGGAGATFYVKETGTGNTGWVAK